MIMLLSLVLLLCIIYSASCIPVVVNPIEDQVAYFNRSFNLSISNETFSSSRSVYLSVQTSNEIQGMNFEFFRACESVGEIDFSAVNIRQFVLSGTLLFAATSVGLSIIDIGDYTDMTEIGSYPVTGATSVCVDESFAYVVDDTPGCKVTILDITIPTSPTHEGELTLSGVEGCWRSKIYGDILYAAVSWDGFHVVSVSDRSSPVFLDSFSNGNPINDFEISVDRKYAYCAFESSGLSILNITNKSRIYETNHLVALSGSAVVVNDGVLYYSDGIRGIRVYELTSGGSNGTHVHTVSTASSCTSLELCESRKYLIAGFYSSGVLILSLKDNKMIPQVVDTVSNGGSYVNMAIPKGETMFFASSCCTFSKVKSFECEYPLLIGTPQETGMSVINLTAVDSDGMGSEDFKLEVKPLCSLNCSSHGYCINEEVCVCDENYFGKNCNITRCFDIWSNDSNVCSSNGICARYDDCICIPSIFYSRECVTKCAGIFSNDTVSRVCSNRGQCLDENVCLCEEHYFGDVCNVSTCSGILSNDSSVCSFGNGTCTEWNTCICSKSEVMELYQYYGSDCEFPATCYNRTFDDDKVCSGKGDCRINGTCACFSSDYSGDECQVWSCFNFSRNDVDNVCHGHGACIAKDSCFCMKGYNPEYAQGPCVDWHCQTYQRRDRKGCGNRGECISLNECECDEGYEGRYCDSWNCVFPKHHPTTCNGHGKCVAPETCECSNAYGGGMCESFTATAAIVTPLALVGFSCVCCVLCGICWGYVIGVLICGLCCGIVGLRVMKQGKQMKRFSRLKNFNILLKEQQLEDDTSIAHIRMRKDMYTIDFDEIKIDKLLGEGGSASSVFQATWKGRVVAFKCFKTRLVMSSQDKFDVFEKEVQVLSSLKHPHIIQFFGATVKPPRVGIVMEYCERGDLMQFLKSYQTYELKELEQKEKIRICYEVSLSMGYLHSRNIVHRDLKCENVLVTDDYSSRLMDFGLSKIVDRMSQVRTTKIGTNIYMAPEVISSDRYNEKCDVFSFAILVYIVITEQWEPYGTKEMMVELKVSSDPLFRPDISVLDGKLDEENQWLRDLVVKNWGHLHEERDSFSRISKVFEKNMQKKDENVGVNSSNNNNNNYEEQDVDSEEDDNRGFVLNEREEVRKKMGFLKKSDFDILMNYFKYLKEQISIVEGDIEVKKEQEKY